MNRALRWTAWVLAVILLLAVVFLVWSNTVMQGTRSAALQVWRDDRVSVRDAGDSVVMAPTGDANGTGIVFIPGAKVDPYAYLATFRQVVASGTTVVITKPTLHLAFFDTRPLATFRGARPVGRDVGGRRALPGRGPRVPARAGRGRPPAPRQLLRQRHQPVLHRRAERIGVP